MLFRMALRNIRKSIKDYTIYFLTLTLSVIVFYVFNSLDFLPSSISLSQGQRELINDVNKLMKYVSLFMILIFGYLVLLVNRFLIKRRSKEFALYLLLGLSKGNICAILFFETIMTGIYALVLGIFLGVWISQGVPRIISRILDVNLRDFSFAVSRKAILFTVVLFVVLFFAVSMYNVLRLYSSKIIDLLNHKNRTGEFYANKKIPSLLIFVISIICIFSSYYLFLKRDDFLIGGSLLILILLLGLAGTILFFYSVTAFFMHFGKKPKVYFSDINMFTLRQISSQIGTNFLSFLVVSIMLFLSISMSSISIGTLSYKNKDADAKFPYDVYVCGYDKSKKIVDMIQEKKIDLNKNFSTFSEFKVANYLQDVILLEKTDETDLVDYFPNLITLSDYNDIVSKFGIGDELSLGANEFSIAVCESYKDYKKNYDETYTLHNEYLNRDLNLVSLNKLSNDIMGNVYTGSPQYYIIIPDDAISEKGSSAFCPYFIGNYKGSRAEINEVERILSDANDSGMNVKTKKAYVYAKSHGDFRIFVSVMGLYISSIFLISGMAILSLKQISETLDSSKRYQILFKLGIEEKSVMRCLAKQNLAYFITPLFLSIMHSFVVMLAFYRFMDEFYNSISVAALLVPAIALLVIYFVYFVGSYVSCKRVVKSIARNL